MCCTLSSFTVRLQIHFSRDSKGSFIVADSGNRCVFLEHGDECSFVETKVCELEVTPGGVDRTADGLDSSAMSGPTQNMEEDGVRWY